MVTVVRSDRYMMKVTKTNTYVLSIMQELQLFPILKFSKQKLECFHVGSGKLRMSCFHPCLSSPRKYMVIHFILSCGTQ